MARTHATRRLALVAIACAAAVVAARSSLATMMVPETLDQLTAEADLVLAGAVVSRTSLWDRGHIVTDVQVHVGRVARGASVMDVTVRIPGGTVGNIGQTIAGAPELLVSRAYVLFLRRDRRGALHTLGLSQGVLPIRLVANPAGAPIATVFPADTRDLALVRAPGTPVSPPPRIVVPPEGRAVDALLDSIARF